MDNQASVLIRTALTHVRLAASDLRRAVAFETDSGFQRDILDASDDLDRAKLSINALLPTDGMGCVLGEQASR
jgi:hypothetical protein